MAVDVKSSIGWEIFASIFAIFTVESRPIKVCCACTRMHMASYITCEVLERNMSILR